MMPEKITEIVIGTLVLIVAVVTAISAAMTLNDKSYHHTYRLQANFADIGGLANGADIRLNGVRIGQVLERHIDPETFDAVVLFEIDIRFRLGQKTKASIASDGLAGNKYILLTPGNDDHWLEPGQIIAHTQSYQSIEDQISRIIFLATQGP